LPKPKSADDITAEDAAVMDADESMPEEV